MIDDSIHWCLGPPFFTRAHNKFYWKDMCPPKNPYYLFSFLVCIQGKERCHSVSLYSSKRNCSLCSVECMLSSAFTVLRFPLNYHRENLAITSISQSQTIGTNDKKTSATIFMCALWVNESLRTSLLYPGSMPLSQNQEPHRLLQGQ
jgi:hypothetical protein